MKPLFLFLLVNLFAFSAFAKPVELALNWKPEPQFGGFYAAEVEGIFKQKSLDVKLIPGGAGTPTIQVAAAGKADFAIVSGEEVLISRSRGTDIVAIFSVYHTFPRVIMTHSERNFKSIQDVFTSPGSISIQSGITFFTFLEKKFGKPKARVVPYLGGISNFLNDPNFSQQAYLNAEPILARNKGAAVKTFLISDEGYNPYSEVLVTRKSFLEQNPELVKHMVEAVREGWEKYLAQPEKTNQHMHKLNPSMDLQTFIQSAEAQKSLIEPPAKSKNGSKPTLGNMTLERWKALGEQLHTLGVIKRIPEAQDLFRNF
jgi:NitT/TauT family transport system substrate-binding protein